MALDPIGTACSKCGTMFSQVPKRTFLGFQKLTCPTCQEHITYPLTSGYRTAYWILFVILIISVFNAFAQGGIGLPGGLGIAVIFALIRDRSIRKRVAKAPLPSTNTAS
jgi:hypothetical protein